MLNGWIIIATSFGYIGLLFLIARHADRRAEAGRSMIANPYVYALSLGVYCTAWTFYGSVGRAAATGAGFLPIYLGPTLVVGLWGLVLRKMIRISKRHRLTSIADFVASRYGMSTTLGGLVTFIAAVAIIPYVALQLDAISTSFTLILDFPAVPAGRAASSILGGGTAFYIALILAGFGILFGTRHLDVSEHHEGLVAAIAFESIVKLTAFVAIGLFVTYGLFNGFGDIFGQAAARPDLAGLFEMGSDPVVYVEWIWLCFLSALAVMFLPRQFQMGVIENTDERHVNKAIWLFPLYLLAINIFVLPIAFAGRLMFAEGAIDADMYVLGLPLSQGDDFLALVAFIGGLSAATSMVIVATVALATMVSNDLLMPVLLRIRRLRLAEHSDVSATVLRIRRVTIVAVVLFGYVYFQLRAGTQPLVSIGLISFAGIAQLAPALLGGIYWRQGNRNGAVAGLSVGFAVWIYTLVLPSLVAPDASLVVNGPFGAGWLRPYELFGLDAFGPITHAMFWSMFLNIGLYVWLSLATRQSPLETRQASLFVDIFTHTGEAEYLRMWRGTTTVGVLRGILGRFLGPARTEALIAAYRDLEGGTLEDDDVADSAFVAFAERQLAGSVGAASARAVLATVAQEEPLTVDEVLGVLDETSRAMAYSRRLEQQQQELEAATAELRKANTRLLELDRLKDEFVTTVTHELRTPLTSIRAFSEILQDNPDLDPTRRREFLDVIQAESTRLTRHINQVLDFSKMSSGAMEWHREPVDLAEVVRAAIHATSQLFEDSGVELHVDVPDRSIIVVAERDRLMQVMLNLLSNAIKFAEPDDPEIWVELSAPEAPPTATVRVADNGPGVAEEDREAVFERFRQVVSVAGGKPQGTGLGLPISREIMLALGGEIWVEEAPQGGAVFCFSLDVADSDSVTDGLVRADQRGELA